MTHTTAEVEYIVDNGDTGTSETGSDWIDGTLYGVDMGVFYGAKVRATDGGTGTNTYTWPLDVASAGKYRVYARWTSLTNRNATATYTVTHAGGTTDVVVNQQFEGGKWVPLGLFDLAPSSSHKVVLADTGSGWTIADAVLIEPLELENRVVSADAVKFVANDAEDVLYVHADHLASPQKMTDDTGAVVWDAAYTPFGLEASITGTASNDNRFPGQYFDTESDLHYNYRRDYDPALGRYLQSDPIGLAGGLNTYGYALSNPLRYTDRYGMQSDGTGGMSTIPPVISPFPPIAIPGTKENTDWRNFVLGICRKIGSALSRDDDKEDECEDLLRVDTDTCNAISRRRGGRAGAICHASASERYSACLANRPLPPLNTWNN